MMGETTQAEWPIERFVSLLNGLADASRLIELGLSELHRIDGARDFAHGMLHLLSHGFERLVKYNLFFALMERDGATPNAGRMKEIGHNVEKGLDELLDVVVTSEKYAKRPAAIADMEFMRHDLDLRRLLALFSRFGHLDRYFDLNVLIDPKVAEAVIDPAAEWREIENEYFARIPGGLEMLASDPEALGQLMLHVTFEIAAVLDRFHRCLTRMWFWKALGEDGPGTATSALSAVNNLQDDQLGLPRPRP